MAAQQNQACTVEVPVGVVGSNAILISGLKADSFVVSESKIQGIREAMYDTSPRRIVFVIDKKSRLGEPAVQILDAMLTKLLQSARSGDTFGVVFAEHPPIPLGDPTPVLAKFHEVMGQHRSKPKDLLDAIADASELFKAPNRGDAMFLFAGQDGLADGRADYQKLYASLCERGVRVFGVLFGFFQAGVYSARAVPGPFGEGVNYDARIDPDERTVHSLTWGTGGYYRHESTNNELQRYRLTDDRLQAMTDLGLQMYGAIAEFYRVRVDSSSSRPKPEPWTLQLSSATPNAQNRRVLYPRHLPPCKTQNH
jgi:hypothetical protein